MPRPITALFWQPKHREKTGKGHGEAGLGISTVGSSFVSIANWEESGIEVPEYCSDLFSACELHSKVSKYRRKHPTALLPVGSTQWYIISSSHSQQGGGQLTANKPLWIQIFPPAKSHMKFSLCKEKKTQNPNPTSNKILLMQTRLTEHIIVWGECSGCMNL